MSNSSSSRLVPHMASSPTTNPRKSPVPIAGAASWYFAIVLLTIILMASIRENSATATHGAVVRGDRLGKDRPCDEIYMVGEGETLHTISEKCDDPFIVERNPHIHDPDDVFPGLVIKIIPSRARN